MHLSRRPCLVVLLLSLLVDVAYLRSARATTSNPLDRFALSDQTPRTFTGRVVERLRAGPYAYLRVRTDVGVEHWVASLALGLTPSDAVVVKVIADAPTFESRRLSRTFSPLFFGVVRDAAHPQHQESK
jgi:hypothetical protein